MLQNVVHSQHTWKCFEKDPQENWQLMVLARGYTNASQRRIWLHEGFGGRHPILEILEYPKVPSFAVPEYACDNWNHHGLH
jgi:hypothetical protein